MLHAHQIKLTMIKFNINAFIMYVIYLAKLVPELKKITAYPVICQINCCQVMNVKYVQIKFQIVKIAEVQNNV